MRTLLKNGKLYDGTGSKAYVGTIVIEDDKIESINTDVEEAKMDRVIDLEGYSVAPGFIDAHSHNDWFAIKKEPMPYFEPFIKQGITTFITGNCGLSSMGFEPSSPFVTKIGGGLFSYQDTKGMYGSVTDFFEAIDQKVPCNIATLVGHCSVRAGLVGMESRKLTETEEMQLLSTLEEALKQGACGISLGLMYEPGLYADTEELKKVASLCLKYNRPLTVHPRANSAVSMAYKEIMGRSHLLRALDELVEIASGTSLKLQYSHAIFVGRRSFQDKAEFLEIIHQLKQSGVEVGFDIYYENMGVSIITVILPSWYQSMDAEKRKKWFPKLKLRILCFITSKLLGFGFEDIEIAYLAEDCRQFEGKTVHQIAKERKESNLDAYLYLCEKSHFKGRVNMSPYSTPQIVSELSKEEECIYMTDAWVEEYGIQNPSIFDCFPKFLKASLKGEGDTIERTIRKMTGQTADRFSLQNRGYLKEGYFADITVFHEETLQNVGPITRHSFGIEKVFINGKLVLKNESLEYDVLGSSGRAIRCN